MAQYCEQNAEVDHTKPIRAYRRVDEWVGDVLRDFLQWKWTEGTLHLL